MNIRHTDPDTHETTVHKYDASNKTTGCGIDTTEFPERWKQVKDAVDCQRNGCKN